MHFRTLIVTTCLLLLAGCATWVAPMSDRPVDGFHGKRTLGARIEDSAIERKAYINAVRTLPALEQGRLVTVSWNGQLLLAGQVPDAEARQKTEAVAAAVRHVAHVHNELETGPAIGFLARMSDATITARVKTRLLFGTDIPGLRTKVVTENGAVYLMGLLTREEADRAVEAARRVYGVQKIVRIVEYIDPSRAQR